MFIYISLIKKQITKKNDFKLKIFTLKTNNVNYDQE